MLTVRETREGLLLSIRVQPRASRAEISGLHDESLKIKVVSPPLEGRANQECVELLSKLFGISKSNIKVVAGEKSRHKKVLITRITFNDLKGILEHQGIDVQG